MSYITMSLGGALVLLCVVFGIYFKMSQDTIQDQAGNISKLTVAVTEQQAAIEQLKIDAAKQAEITQELDGKYQASREQVSTLIDKFAKNNLGNLAAHKPGLIEKAINKGSREVNRCFEVISGATAQQLGINEDEFSKLKVSCAH
jgi:hypothetical protein